MYKIYLNETPLYLLDTEEVAQRPAAGENHMLARYTGRPKFLLNYIDMMEKSRRFESVSLYFHDYEQLIADFKSNFKLIEAAGGLVFNRLGEALFIFRRGFWDLPKGKIEKGEGKQEAALREVKEETGLDQLAAGSYLCRTHHTYRLESGKRILKVTYWYKMETDQLALIPQAEEDIEKAVWMGLEEFLSKDRIVYRSIRDVLMFCKKNNC